MREEIRRDLVKYGAYTTKNVVSTDEDSNFGELLLWTAERTASTSMFKQTAVVENEYKGYKYPHAIIIPQDVSCAIVTNVSNESIYPVHVTARVLDSNPFRAIRSLASINSRLIKMFIVKPTIESLTLPERGGTLQDIRVVSAPILPSGRGENEYETTVRIEYIVREPWNPQKVYDD